MKALAWLALLAFGCSPEDAADPERAEDQGELVGGVADLRWPAAGYLVHAATEAETETAPVSCGATLVAPDLLVTAALCVLAAPDDVWAFGSGHAGSAPLTRVKSMRVHPDFHPEPQSHVDVRYYLRNFDVATVRLERSLDIEPARLPDTKTPV